MIETRAVHKANEIRLKRQIHAGTFLVVEGRDDRLFMQQFASSEKCQIEVAQGKDNVLEVIRILNEAGFPGVLGLVDADFDRLHSSDKGECNLVKPEYHDLETMLICSAALDRVLVELGSQQKLISFDEKVLDALICRALPLGSLRFYSLRYNLKLKFNGIRYSAWINRVSFTGCIRRMVEEVKNFSQRHDLNTDIIEQAILDIMDAGYDPRELCNGTDLIEILGIGLRGRLGNKQPNEVNASSLKQYLRLAYSDQDFCNSDLGRSIRHWEKVSHGFKVLRKQLNIPPT